MNRDTRGYLVGTTNQELSQLQETPANFVISIRRPENMVKKSNRYSKHKPTHMIIDIRCLRNTSFFPSSSFFLNARNMLSASTFFVSFLPS